MGLSSASSRRDRASKRWTLRRPIGPTSSFSTSACLTSPGCGCAPKCGKWSSVPIIVLSAHRSESEKIRFLNEGADDYVTKPFHPGELVARVQAVSSSRYPTPGSVMMILGVARARTLRARGDLPARKTRRIRRARTCGTWTSRAVSSTWPRRSSSRPARHSSYHATPRVSSRFGLPRAETGSRKQNLWSGVATARGVAPRHEPLPAGGRAPRHETYSYLSLRSLPIPPTRRRATDIARPRFG